MSASELIEQNLLVVGLGLIGGSLAKDCKDRGVFKNVIGYSRKPETMETALELGIVDSVEHDLGEAIGKADIVFLAVPILTTSLLIEAIQPHLKEGTIVTDGGSVKGSVLKSAKEFLTKDQQKFFVPGHPIAGAEDSGVHAARSGLYQNQKIILTPSSITHEWVTEVVKEMWQAVGGMVDIMPAWHHDNVLAATSHLPHLLAFNLVDALAKHSDYREIFNYAAGGFRDFTRIAASDPIMWHDIFQANRGAVLNVLDQFMLELNSLRDALESGDGEYMKKVFTDAKKARNHFSDILNARAKGKDLGSNND